jgi:hypothetical protein
MMILTIVYLSWGSHDVCDDQPTTCGQPILVGNIPSVAPTTAIASLAARGALASA